MKTKLFILGVLLLFSINQTFSQELWGMTRSGGQDDIGTIFKTDLDGNRLQVEHSMEKIHGYHPNGDLTEASNGKLYGMTSEGGRFDYGVLFEYDPATNIYSKKLDFDGANKGQNPYGSLIQASNGKLYGMTYEGGISNVGVLFEYDPATDIFTKKLDFDWTDKGRYPYGTLIQAFNGKLYGMTSSGGSFNDGVLFEFDPATNAYSKKLEFDGVSLGGGPLGSLMQASNGKLYGMTTFGGNFYVGVLFEYDPVANTYAKKLDFDGAAKGSHPFGSLIQASDGNLYGMAGSGGSSGSGVLFEYNLVTNTYTKKLEFDGATKGRNPEGSLKQASNGKLYGMTSIGGNSDLGVLFEYNPSTNTYSKKLDFNGIDNGSKPHGSLMQASNGKLHGTTANGGNIDMGVIFEYDFSTNNYTKKVDFNLYSQGSYPSGSLIQGFSGKLYGMTGYGGNSGMGILFEYNPIANTYYKKLDFDGAGTGGNPLSSLLQTSDGKLYGVTYIGGISDKGVLFECEPTTNTYAKKLDFDGTNNGRNPIGSLMQASNGKLYGMTYNGGISDRGVLFEYDPVAGTFAKSLDFDGPSMGSYPSGSLVQAANGKLYGMTRYGGSSYHGVIFEFDIATNSYTKKLEFDGASLGRNPYGSLMHATNGKIYGMTAYGGSVYMGVLFEYDPITNIYAKKVDFDGEDKGGNPYGSLMQASNGKLYGMTTAGGSSDRGVLFEYDPATDTFTKKLDFDGSNGSNPYYTQLIEINYDQYTWSGTANSDWDNAANWSTSKTPLGTNSAVIPANLSIYPSITNATYVNNLNMESNASLTGQENLTVNGTLIIEREFTGYTSTSDGWYFLSSPVSNQIIDSSDFAPVPNVDYLYNWGDATGEWLNYTGGSFGDAQFEVGKGYLVAYDTTSIKEFSGSFNTSSVTKNLSYTDGMGDGWNLLGNPYPSAIDWDLVTRSGDVDNAVYFINPTDGAYNCWVSGLGEINNGEIPANQGFFVKANSGGQTVTMDLADQLHSTNVFNKSTTTLPANSIKISLTGAGLENNTYLRFDANATATFDSESDAYKLFGFAVIPQVYTQLGETDYSINSVNFPTEIMTIPLGIHLYQDTDLSFEISGMEGLNTSIRIELEDKAENKLVNLREQNSYTFRGTTADEADRFLLHCSQATGVETTEAQDAQIYAFGGRVYILMEEGAQYSEMSLFDVSGRLISTQNITSQSLQSFDFRQLTGVYIVQLKGENSSLTNKITL